MPSIREIFADPDLDAPGGDDVEIDLDKVLSSVTDILNDRPATPDAPPPPSATAEAPVAPEEVEPEEAVDTPSPVAGETDEEEEPEPTPVVETPPPASAHDPWLDIPAERRAAILALDQTLVADEGKRAKVFGILSGDSDAPVAPPAPTLPDHVDPDSFEATLWREQQETRQLLTDIAGSVKAQATTTAQDRARVAATNAATRFGTKYAGKLDSRDVMEIAQYAATTGMPAAFMGTAEAKADPTVGYEQALEHVLWTNESFRARVLGTDAPPVPPGNQPEATERKRKLTAISGSASPVAGSTPQRSPLEHGVDGKLTEQSRQSLIKEAASMIRQNS